MNELGRGREVCHLDRVRNQSAVEVGQESRGQSKGWKKN